MRPLVAIAVATALATGCGDSDPSPPTPADLAEIDTSPDVTITVDEDGFEPREVHEVIGTVFLLVNEGDEPHSFTADDQEFDTGRLLPGESTTLVLVEPGRHDYHDDEDPDHTGRLVVSTE